MKDGEKGLISPFLHNFGMPQIRNYKDSDYIGVRCVLKEGDLYYSGWDSRKNLKEKISKDKKSVTVAVAGKKIVGVIYIIHDGWASFIFRLCVLESHRKSGIGSALLKHAEKTLITYGKKDVSLFVESNDKNLLSYYKKRGFKEVKSYVEMYKTLR